MNLYSFNAGVSYLDNEGNPLHGRVTFINALTEDTATIYDEDGAIITNPVLTNSIGQLSNEVFLDNSVEYIVKFDKLLADGTYAFQYSKHLSAYVYELALDYAGEPIVANIAALKAIAEPSGTVVLQGYYAAGDKPAVRYKWVSNETTADNGGSYIKPSSVTGAGRWVLINSFIDGVDVRHFGAFPAGSAADTSDTMNYRIMQANAYALGIGVPLVFPATSTAEYSYYRIDNINLTNAITSKHVRLCVKTGYSASLMLDDSQDYVDIAVVDGFEGDVSVNGRTLRTSITKGATVDIWPTETLIIDSDIHGTRGTWTNLHVKLAYDFSSYVNPITFNNCTFEGRGHITSALTHLNFVNCPIDGSIFSSSYNVRSGGVTFQNCTSEVDNWPLADQYYDFCVSNHSVYIDMKFKSISNEHKSVAVAATLANAICKTSNGLGFKADMRLVNCDIYCHVNDGYGIEAEDSTVLFTNEAVMSMSKLVARNSTISGSHRISVNNVDLNSCNMSVDLESIGGNASVRDCDVYGLLMIYDNNGLINNVTYSGNRINTSSYSLYTTTDKTSGVAVSNLIVTDNIVVGTRRDFYYNQVGDAGTYASTCVFERNTNVIRSDKVNINVYLQMSFSSINTTDPYILGTEHIVETEYGPATTGYYYDVVNFNLGKFLFSFSSKLVRPIQVRFELADYLESCEFYDSTNSLRPTSKACGTCVWNEIRAAGTSITTSVALKHKLVTYYGRTTEGYVWGNLQINYCSDDVTFSS